MDSNSNEKKPKRPRIGQSFHAPAADGEREQRPAMGSNAPTVRMPTAAIVPNVPTSPVSGYNNNGGYNNGPPSV